MKILSKESERKSRNKIKLDCKRKLSRVTVATLAVLFLFASTGLIAVAYSPGKNVVSSGYSIASNQTHDSSPSGSVVSSAVRGCLHESACVYVADDGNNYVSVLQGARLLTTITLPAGGCASGVNYAPDALLVFVADYCLNELDAYYATTNTFAGSITGLAHVAFGVYDPSNGMLYYSGLNNNAIYVINPTTLALATTISPTCGPTPEFADYDSVNGMVYFADHSGCMDEINPSTNALTTISLPGGAGTFVGGVAVNQATGNIYVDDQGLNQVYAVAITGAITTIISPSFSKPWGDAYSPATNEIYVANTGSNTVVPISASNAVGTPISVGSVPAFDCFSPTSDYIYVSNSKSSAPVTVTAINTKNAVQATISLGINGSSPYGCAAVSFMDENVTDDLAGFGASVGGYGISVETDVKVPNVTCPVANALSLFEVGVGDVGLPTGAQRAEGGIYAQCIAGTVTYGEFNESLTSYSFYNTWSPKPGNLVSIYLVLTGLCTGQVTVSDLSTKQKIALKVGCGGGPSLAWCGVNMYPGRNPLFAQVDFGTVSFTKCRIGVAGGAPKQISYYMPYVFEYTSINLPGTSILSAPQIPGDYYLTNYQNFDVTFYNPGP
jgi:YVTN family beta-propeller protein